MVFPSGVRIRVWYSAPGSVMRSANRFFGMTEAV